MRKLLLLLCVLRVIRSQGASQGPRACPIWAFFLRLHIPSPDFLCVNGRAGIRSTCPTFTRSGSIDSHTQLFAAERLYSQMIYMSCCLCIRACTRTACILGGTLKNSSCPLKRTIFWSPCCWLYVLLLLSLQWMPSIMSGTYQGVIKCLLNKCV